MMPRYLLSKRIRGLSAPAYMVICCFLVGCSQEPAAEQAELLFVHEVYPLIQEKCTACHGGDPDDIEGDFDVRSREGMLSGGASGKPALIPGNPANSLLYEAVTWANADLEMPPKENDRLSEAQVDLIHRWIASGAPWPNTIAMDSLRHLPWDYSDGIKVATSGGLSPAWTHRRYQPEDLWAFAPVKDVEVPWKAIKQREKGNPVDAFVARSLSAHKVKPAQRADRLTLIRRATFNLTGLPPTPAEVEAFLQDTQPNAFDRLVERLLDSPRYGEHWGRHWLDVVRYADSNGFANDYERPNAWRYRDYVIRAFNEDKPYNQFVLEQLAGDEIDPSNPEFLIATGFLRMGPWEHTGMSVEAETRQFFLDDVTNSVGETFLSLPLRCASCHDHKFDPIPTRDYYRVQAVFAPVQFAERKTPYLPQENIEGFEEGLFTHKNRVSDAQIALQRLVDKEVAAAKRWFAARGLPYATSKRWDKVAEAKLPPRNIGLSDEELGYKKLLQKRLQVLSREGDRYEPLSFSVFNGTPITNRNSSKRMLMPTDPGSEVQPVYILAGGSVHAPTDSVAPGVLSAVGIQEQIPAPLDVAVAQDSVVSVDNTLIHEHRDGRRLAFAEWLVDAKHPITARSIVNRIWQYHFGNGLAGNANNFGVMGKKPTHPDLLDWLATYFVENGWSIKAMHQLIMSSETYQRASEHRRIDNLRSEDPDNKLLAYFNPRRLTAEELRDAMLFVSGELNTTMGGLPVKPEINIEVALQPRHIMGSVAPAYQPSRTPAQRNRRTIYAYRYRGLPDPLLEVFNKPSADISCEQRTESSVTPQVFTLMNSQNTQDRALAMAMRLRRETGVRSAQVQRSIQLTWGRAATDAEIEVSTTYVDKMIVYHRANVPAKSSYPKEVERNMFEEMTGKPFKYTERLDVYENYVADVKSWEVDEEIRALADLAKVLFNANEFVYIY
ncbi:MAG: PSD1 and planctomycete cytochrome C domain-containing protein [Bacteroidota bacterium]